MPRVRSIRKTSYRLRAQGRCAKQTMLQKQRKEKGVVYIVASLLVPALDPGTKHELFWHGIVQLALYHCYRNILLVNRRWQYRPPPRFCNLEAGWCWSMLRFRKCHLWRISQALLLPAELQLDNGMWTNNEEMLIVTLLRLASMDVWLKLESVIQVEYSRMSRVYKVSIRFFIFISLYYCWARTLFICRQPWIILHSYGLTNWPTIGTSFCQGYANINALCSANFAR